MDVRTYVCKYSTLCCMALVNDHTNIHGIQDSVHTYGTVSNYSSKQVVEEIRHLEAFIIFFCNV